VTACVSSVDGISRSSTATSACCSSSAIHFHLRRTDHCRPPSPVTSTIAVGCRRSPRYSGSLVDSTKTGYYAQILDCDRPTKGTGWHSEVRGEMTSSTSIVYSFRSSHRLLRASRVIPLAIVVVTAACNSDKQNVDASDQSEPSALRSSSPSDPAALGSSTDSSAAQSTAAPEPDPTVTSGSRSPVGLLDFELPTTAVRDPRAAGAQPRFVLDYERWIVPGRNSLMIAIQDIEPKFPADEAFSTFESNGLVWSVFGTGPQDGTTITAVTSVEGHWVLVSAQAWVAGDRTQSGAVVEQVARSARRVGGASA
jgi:hypothetical protein